MKISKAFFVALGFISLAVGTIGTVVPLVPTVPLYLLAAYCFARSSQRLHDWFVNTTIYKKHLASYAQGRGLTWKVKSRIMLIVTAQLALGFVLMGNKVVGRTMVALTWAGLMLYFVYGIKTYMPAEKAD